MKEASIHNDKSAGHSIMLYISPVENIYVKDKLQHLQLKGESFSLLSIFIVTKRIRAQSKILNINAF